MRIRPYFRTRARLHLGALALTLLAAWLGPPSRPLPAQTLDTNSDIQYSFDDGALRDLGDANRDPVLLAQRIVDNNAPSSTQDYAPRDFRGPGDGIDGRNDRLIDRVVDPISWLMHFRFREDWNWPVADSAPDSQQFQFRAAVPFVAWDRANLLRVTVPYNVQGSGAPGLGKVSIFDALVFEPDWGRWGVGPEVRFDPQSSSGQDTFQMGPVFGAVTKSKHWTLGFISENFLGGDDSQSQIQLILAYKFNEQLAVTLGEMEFEYDWNEKKWTQLPLGIELDYIADLWGQKLQFFVDPQYNFQTTSSSSGWTVFVGLTLLVPDA